MKNRYVDNHHDAFIRVASVHSDLAVITSVYVTPVWRRHGYATALLREVLRDADDDGVQLRLQVKQLAADGPGAKALVAWYMKLGFVFHPKATGRRILMIRQPQ